MSKKKYELNVFNLKEWDKYEYNTINYKYNKDGIRISKEINNIKTMYYVENNNIIFEATGNDVIYYLREVNGRLIGFKYNDTTYYYVKNAQDDIIGILDSNYNIVSKYEYDSWGNPISILDQNGNDVSNNVSHIANINPFRYRSYYYDNETSLYYLTSRYYNSVWGRFVNIDSFVNTMQGMNSNNMYIYTENNPVSRVDAIGSFWFQIAGALIGGFISVTINGISNVINGNKWYSNWQGAFLGGALSGFIATTPIGFTSMGKATMAYGGAFIQSGINEALSSSKRRTAYSFENVVSDTVINGTTSMIVKDPITINKYWARPEKISTSFTGEYQKKLAVNNTVVTAVANQIAKIMNEVASIMVSTIDKKLETIIGKTSSGAGAGGGFSGGSGFGGGGLGGGGGAF